MLLAFISFHFGTQFQFMFFLFCHNLFPFSYHWLLQDLWESTSVLWTKFNRFFATPSHWLWFGDLQKHEQHISYEIVMKSIVTWKCWMIISPFCLRLCTPLVAELYTSLWGCWSLLCNRILVIGDILCQRAAMLFKLIVLTMEVIVHWLLPGTIADNLLFAFLLLNLGLKTKRFKGRLSERFLPTYQRDWLGRFVAIIFLLLAYFRQMFWNLYFDVQPVYTQPRLLRRSLLFSWSSTPPIQKSIRCRDALGADILALFILVSWAL